MYRWRNSRIRAIYCPRGVIHFGLVTCTSPASMFSVVACNARLLQVARTATKGEGTAVGVEIAIGLKNKVLESQKIMAKSRLGKINSKPTCFLFTNSYGYSWHPVFWPFGRCFRFCLRAGWAKSLDIAKPWRCRRCPESPGRLRRGLFLTPRCRKTRHET